MACTYVKLIGAEGSSVRVLASISSGSPISRVTAELVKALGLSTFTPLPPPSGIKNEVGVKEASEQWVRDLKVVAGPSAVTVNAFVMPSEGEDSGLPVPLILGIDWLVAAGVGMDYGQQQLVFQSNGSSHPFGSLSDAAYGGFQGAFIPAVLPLPATSCGPAGAAAEGSPA